MWETLKNWDRDLFIYLNQLGSERFDGFWLFCTRIESWIFLFFIFLFLYFKWFPKKRALLFSGFTVLTFIVAFGLKFLVKDLVGRIRPNNNSELAELIRVLQFPGDFSFFSGHAVVSFAITTFVVLAMKPFSKWVHLFWLWPVLFSLSRIYVGVHYPSDILVGTIIGVSIGKGMYQLEKWYFNKKAQQSI